MSLADGANPDTVRTEVDFDEANFVLYEYASGVFEIHVVANQSAFYYFIEHPLSAVELAQYRTQGRAALLALANRVRRNKA